jgi:hypothetical protein
VIEIDPDFGEAYQKLAQIFFQQKQYSTSWEYMTKAERNGITPTSEFKEKLIAQLLK